MMTKERVEKLRSQLSWLDSASFELANTCLALYEREEGLRKVLERIAHHPHCAYGDGPFISDHDSGYKMGIADGHRCAAQEARAALKAEEVRTGGL